MSRWVWGLRQEEGKAVNSRDLAGRRRVLGESGPREPRFPSEFPGHGDDEGLVPVR